MHHENPFRFIFYACRVAELPHKLPHFALLVSLLSVTHQVLDSSDTTEAEPRQPSIGLQIVRDLSRSFQLHIDNRRWRSTRLFLHFFGHLHSLSRPLVSSQSLLALLRAIFNATTDELTCAGARADECLRMVVEGLLRSRLLKVEDDDLKKEVAELIESIRVHMVVNRRIERSLFNEAEALSQYIDPVEELVATLDDSPAVEVLPVLDEPFEPIFEMRMRSTGLESPYSAPFDLPIVLLPPDDEDPSINAQPLAPKTQVIGEGPGPVPLDSKDRKGYLGIKLLLQLFTDETVPSRATVDGVVLRTLVNDIIDVFEVNRKECAKILLELPRWVGRGTFKVKSLAQRMNNANGDDSADSKDSNWVLEHLTLEAILGSVFAMPSPPIRPAVYYYSLIAELCRLSPSTVAPGLGKCVRKLYGGLGETGSETLTTRLEPEGIRRFAEWFAIHLSNFGFTWAWKDWTEIADLPSKHPKRVFAARVLELEIRLSYFDRIKGTVPSDFIESGVIPQEAPGPSFEFENKEHRDHLAALDVIQLLKRKETVPRLIEYLTKMKERLTSEGIEESVDDVTREVAVQALLSVGSRSFSHFLNVLERYLELLKNLSNSGNARGLLLKTVSKFWQKNPQFELIVIDKLLEYRVVDPVDGLQHAFDTYRTGSWGDIHFWDVAKLTIEKVTRRVSASRLKLERLKKAEEDERDIERAAGGNLLEPANGASAPADADDVLENKDENEDKTDEKLEEGDEGQPILTESESKQKVLDDRKQEIEEAEKELEANVAEKAEVFSRAAKMFSLASWQAEEKRKEDEEGEETNSQNENDLEKDDKHLKANVIWKAWWLRGWCKEFCRLFAIEIAEHYELIEESLEQDPNGSVEIHQAMNESIRLTKEFVEYSGVQSMQ
ncbi:MIF4G like-domain-containing protein [Phakopsora pachyrhizi]|uniref:MIF4G like-domain-containing protein n=1 Tax=Phakopsora pachyrhizi TaxID=170000 RepID=A0AAV0BCT7_PHAPC|nr:MIF4G like-domain-containing protein [Phakopsora pachyrhizi]CAH7685100.1 MIF4G like-domain-containing protein [Phakopsora pachyrhizi]